MPSAPFEGGYRLLPRYASDIVVQPDRLSPLSTPRPTVVTTPAATSDRSVFFVGGITPQATPTLSRDEVATVPTTRGGAPPEWLWAIPLGLALALAIFRLRGRN